MHTLIYITFFKKCLKNHFYFQGFFLLFKLMSNNWNYSRIYIFTMFYFRIFFLISTTSTWSHMVLFLSSQRLLKAFYYLYKFGLLGTGVGTLLYRTFCKIFTTKYTKGPICWHSQYPLEFLHPFFWSENIKMFIRIKI